MIPFRLSFAASLLLPVFAGGAAADPAEEVFRNQVRPVLEEYCFSCHSREEEKGDLDLERFDSRASIVAEAEIWQGVLEQLEMEAMPPPKKPQLSPQQKAGLSSWLKAQLRSVAEARAGDPGPVVLRRLSNAEYTWTLRDLTGLETLDPAREFPVDGAAGEGFTNAGAALVMSPSLITKYLEAGKAVASHAVLLPGGVAFSSHTTPSDWAEEKLEAIRAFYARFSVPGAESEVELQGLKFQSNEAGVIPLERYLAATLTEQSRLASGAEGVAEVATERGLNAKYLGRLWQTLRDPAPSWLLGQVQEKWRSKGPGREADVVEMVRIWQGKLWKFSAVGQIGKRDGPGAWQEPVVPAPDSAHPDLTEVAMADFRAVFPAALCYTKIVPADEVVTLLLYYREDELLKRLMLNEAETAEIDRLWEELHFVSGDALKLVDVFEQLYQYATQDADPSAFEPMRVPIREQAEAFRRKQKGAEPAHVAAVVDFATQAWRRPLSESERTALLEFYWRLRTEDLAHDDAVRLLLARVLTAPAFLYKVEEPGPGAEASAVNDRELAARLSYFLWSSAPDEPLRRRAEAGELRDPAVLAAETRRMLRDGKVRRLAVEFGCQWLLVRDFAELDEKSEAAFPDFAGMRRALGEEPVQLFTHLFMNNGRLLDLLDGDYTFLNAPLAEYYQISLPGGGEWQKVTGVRAQGRGGVLGLGATLARQSGASRTSPILRGNWICETLLGEKLPRPPKGVPVLPEEAPAGLTERELTSRHSADPACSGCHVRIDPFGFALEHYDAIGRRREVDAAGLRVDARSRTADGTELDGMESLTRYLGTVRRDDFVRQFCRKLLGYALGRGVILSDELLLDEMQAALAAEEFRVGVAVERIVLSPQFREIRGLQNPLNHQ